ncbi:MAG TPA: hypothetical protein VF155_08095 [Candidatus Dormibacteraeota bacterium]
MGDVPVIRRILPSVLLAVALLSAAFAVLGPPNLGAVLGFFAGGMPTIAEGEAVVALLSWTVVVAVAGICVGGSALALTRSAALRQRSRRGVLVFVAGLLLIAVSLVQRSLPGSISVCCGDDAAATQEAQSLGTR